VSTRVDAKPVSVLVVVDDPIDETRIATAKTRESLERFVKLIGLETSEVSFAGRDIVLDLEAGWPRSLPQRGVGRTMVSELMRETLPRALPPSTTRDRLTTIAILAALGRGW